jgi:GWxTD domain-containing protein
VFSLEPGAYRARVRVELPGGDGLEREAAFRVPDDAGEDLVLGELTLGCCVEEESPPDTLVPHGAGAFGEGTTPCVGFRVADGRPDLPDSAYQVRVRLRHDAEEVAHELRLPRGGRFAEGFWRSDALGAGSYTLTVEARVGKLRKERTARFSVAGTRVARDPWVMRALIEYVATPEELQEAEQAPDDSLAAVWTRFWERRDPDPGTPVNEALVLFETRVETASRRYGVMEPGWQSDQGRIYIRLGEPDRVETIAADAYRAAGEIWYYYGRHATYVFQDVDGFGRLRLVGGR